jgi:hypothetical protein
MIMTINFRIEIILLIIILILLLLAPMLLSCGNQSPYTLLEGFKEGFVNGVKNTLNKDNKLPTSSETPEPATNSTLKLKSKKTEGFTNYKKHSDIPLIFDNTKFSPKCCPNTYSNSMGCACLSMPQYKFLIERGGNNVPFSQY